MVTVDINKASYKGDYKINFLFSDGIERTIDFADFLKRAKNPMTEKYLDKQLFQSFSLEHGDIHWNDFEMCFPIWSLYEGNI